MSEDKYTLKVNADIKNLGEAKDFVQEKLGLTDCLLKKYL